MAATNDLLIMQGFNSNNPLRLTFQEAGTPSRTVTGIVKLCQRVLMLFLTRRGTVKFKPDEGTSFLDTLFSESLSWAGAGEIISIASSAMVDVRRQIIETEDLLAPTDERISEISVDSADIVDTTVLITLTVTSLAGTTRTVILPVQTAVPS